VRLDHDAVRVDVDDEMRLRLPLLSLSGIVMFGHISMTSKVLERFSEDGKSVVWLDNRGRFRARVEGRVRGNVLLRRAQHLALSDPDQTLDIARQIVAGKIQNARQVLLRGARETKQVPNATNLETAAVRLASSLDRLRSITTLDQIRGIEGEAARTYFEAMPSLVKVDRSSLAPKGRSKRPPRDPANSVLSFLYALLRVEYEAALEGVGLDPQVGYLHTLRPGRPALALDLMEELRPVVADRLALSLINRRQLQKKHFDRQLGGKVLMTDDGRRTVIDAYQRRKNDLVTHRVLAKQVPIRVLPHVQARLLARHLRGDLLRYPPFHWR
jgi:CRISPR-associated protein Cas1